MPLQPYQKEWLVKAHGYDPSQWTTDDEGQNLVRIQPTDNIRDVQPSTSSSTVIPVVPPGDSPLETGVKSFAEAAPSVMGGGAAAGLTALGLTGAGMSMTGAGALVGLPLMALAGLGGGFLTRKLQQKIEPQAWQENVAASQALNPKSALAGNLLAMPLGGMSLSPTGLLRAGRALPKALLGGSLKPEEAQSLLNVGAGAGIGAGSSVLEDIQSGRPFDIKNLLENAALGMGFNRPNQFGRLYGFKPVEPFDIAQRARESLTAVPPQVPTTPTGQVPDVTPPPVMELNPSIYEPELAPHQFPKAPEPYVRAVGEPGKAAEESAQAMQGIWKQNADLQRMRMEQIRDLQNYRAKADIAKAKADAINAERAAKEAEMQAKWEEAERTTAFEKARAEKVSQEQVPPPTPASPNTLRITKEGLLPPDITRPEARPEGYEYSPESQLRAEAEKYTKTPFEKEMVPRLGEQPIHPTKEYFNLMETFNKLWRGIKTRYGTEELTPTGKPAAGTTIPSNREIVLNPEKMYTETVPHEAGGHMFLKDMLSSSRPREARAAKNYLKLVEDSPEYKAWAKANTATGERTTPEEYIATNEGYEFIRRSMNLDKESPFTEWWKDLSGYWKTRYGKHATEEDYRRLQNYEYMYRKPFSRTGVEGIAAPREFSQESELRRQAGEGKVPRVFNRDEIAEGDLLKNVAGYDVSTDSLKNIYNELNKHLIRERMPALDIRSPEDKQFFLDLLNNPENFREILSPIDAERFIARANEMNRSKQLIDRPQDKFNQPESELRGSVERRARMARNYQQIIMDMRTRGYKPANIVTESPGYIVSYSNHSNDWYIGPGARRNKGEEVSLGVNQIFVPGTLDEASFISDNLPSHDKIFKASVNDLLKSAGESLGIKTKGGEAELPNVQRETSDFVDKLSEPYLGFNDKFKLASTENELQKYIDRKNEYLSLLSRGNYSEEQRASLKEGISRFDEQISKWQKKVEAFKSKEKYFSPDSELKKEFESRGLQVPSSNIIYDSLEKFPEKYAWMTPSSKIVDASIGHEDTAVGSMKLKGVKPGYGDFNDDVYKEMYKKGFLRIARMRNTKELFVDGQASMSQINNLKDYSIEHQLVLNYNGKVLYDPNEPQFSAESLLKQTKSPEFQKWFEGSKVVDEKGEPLVVYHGTPTPDFTIFDPEKGNHGYNLFGKGVYLAGDPELGSTYAQEMGQKKGGVYPLFAKIKNPFEADTISQGEVIPFIEKLNSILKSDYTWNGEIHGIDVGNPTIYALSTKRNAGPLKFSQRWEGPEKVWALEGINGVRMKNTFGKDFSEVLKEMGYDGIHYYSNWRTGINIGKNKDVYVAFDPTQIKSATANVGTFDPINPDINYSPDSVLRKLFESRLPEIEKIRRIEHPMANDVADAANDFYEYRRQYLGRFTNDIVGKLLSRIPLTHLKEKFYQNTPEMDRVVQRRMELSDNNKSNITLTPEEQSIDNDFAQFLKVTLDEKNKYPELRHTIADPNYIPFIPSRKALDAILQHPNSAEAKSLIDDWYNYYQNTLGKTHDEARDALRIFRAGYTKQQSELASSYGPIDKAAGLGIPSSWREHNLVDIAARFANRYGRRLAYHRAFEMNKPVMDALDDPDSSLAAADPVKNVIEDIQGVRETEEAFRTAAGGLVRAAMLGPLTGGKDFVTNPFLGMQHMTIPQAIRSPIEALVNMSQSRRESFEMGVNRHNLAGLELGEGGINEYQNVLRRLRDIVNVGQGRNVLEQMTRAVAFGQGKYVAADNILAAKKGTLSSQGEKFLNDFAPKDWKTYVSKGEFPIDVLKEIAAKYVESVQGTYTYQGLPSVAQKGTFAPYLSLARWNIEKLSNFEKYVVKPALNGNFQPLLMSTIGMLIGGAASTKLTELATGKKEKTPKISELTNLEGKDLIMPLTYKLAGLVSLGGYAGIVGDLAKAGMDWANKNRPQTYGNPLVDGISTATEDVGDIIEAMRNGDVNLTGDALSKLLEDYFQAYRIALAQLSPEKKEQLSDINKMRDLRTFKLTHGEPVSPISSDRPNLLMNPDVRRFKKTSDLSEAVGLMPSLIQRAIERSNGDPFRLEQELRSLKQNNYQTMPSPDNMPLSFIKYITWLTKTQGPKAASDRLSDYLIQNELNTAKSSMIP